MVLLGVILVLLAAGAGVLLFLGTAQITDTVDITILGGTLSLPPLTLLITGMVLISLFWLGWAMLRGGLRRGKRRRTEAKEAAAAAEARRVEDGRRMQEEFAARERELVEERRRREQETALREQEDTTHSGPATEATRSERDHPDTRVDERPTTTSDATRSDATRSGARHAADDSTRPVEGRDTRQV
jgi:hypothetical protein